MRRGLKVLVVNPKPEQARAGNSVTAHRWAGFLRDLGHETDIAEEFTDQPCDALVALHARRSAPSVDRFRKKWPGAPLVVALTGTDLYRDLERSEAARRAVRAADRLVVLQPLGRDRLPPELRDRVRVIHQSAVPPEDPPAPRADAFVVSLLSHLRPVKAPLLGAAAVRRLPASSRALLLHAGRALGAEMEERARAEMDSNERYRWLGELPRDEALELLAGSRLMLLTSRLEGGANVVTEALACGTPVLSTRIDGSVGILGADYPGYFPVGDADALAALLARAERDEEFYGELEERCHQRAPLADPDRERGRWAELMEELGARVG